jgi:hypothetical protein
VVDQPVAHPRGFGPGDRRIPLAGLRRHLLGGLSHDLDELDEREPQHLV